LSELNFENDESSERDDTLVCFKLPPSNTAMKDHRQPIAEIDKG